MSDYSGTIQYTKKGVFSTNGNFETQEQTQDKLSEEIDEKESFQTESLRKKYTKFLKFEDFGKGQEGHLVPYYDVFSKRLLGKKQFTSLQDYIIEKKITKKLRKQISNPKQFSTLLTDVSQYQAKSNCILYENGLCNLQDYNQQMIENNVFWFDREEELYYLAITLFDTIMFLMKNSIFHGNIKPINIVLYEKSYSKLGVKLTDNSGLTFSYKDIEAYTPLYFPDIKTFKAYETEDKKVQAEIYQLGRVLLELCLSSIYSKQRKYYILLGYSNIADFQKVFFSNNADAIRNSLQLIQNYYSSDLCDLIASFLSLKIVPQNLVYKINEFQDKKSEYLIDFFGFGNKIQKSYYHSHFIQIYDSFEKKYKRFDLQLGAIQLELQFYFEFEQDQSGLKRIAHFFSNKTAKEIGIAEIEQPCIEVYKTLYLKRLNQISIENSKLFKNLQLYLNLKSSVNNDAGNDQQLFAAIEKVDKYLKSVVFGQNVSLNLSMLFFNEIYCKFQQNEYGPINIDPLINFYKQYSEQSRILFESMKLGEKATILCDQDGQTTLSEDSVRQQIKLYQTLLNRVEDKDLRNIYFESIFDIQFRRLQVIYSEKFTNYSETIDLKDQVNLVQSCLQSYKESYKEKYCKTYARVLFYKVKISYLNYKQQTDETGQTYYFKEFSRNIAEAKEIFDVIFDPTEEMMNKMDLYLNDIMHIKGSSVEEIEAHIQQNMIRNSERYQLTILKNIYQLESQKQQQYKDISRQQQSSEKLELALAPENKQIFEFCQHQYENIVQEEENCEIKFEEYNSVKHLFQSGDLYLKKEAWIFMSLLFLKEHFPKNYNVKKSELELQIIAEYSQNFDSNNVLNSNYQDFQIKTKDQKGNIICDILEDAYNQEFREHEWYYNVKNEQSLTKKKLKCKIEEVVTFQDKFFMVEKLFDITNDFKWSLTRLQEIEDKYNNQEMYLTQIYIFKLKQIGLQNKKNDYQQLKDKLLDSELNAQQVHSLELIDYYCQQQF